MHLDNSSINGEDGNQESEENGEKEESIHEVKPIDEDGKLKNGKKRRRIRIDLKRLRLMKEKLLKLPMSDVDSNLEPSPTTVFDCESDESDSDQECGAILASMAQLHGLQQETSDLPYEFKKVMSFMGGSEPKLVIEKRLRRADVDQSRNRLLILQRVMKTNFLEVEEEEKLNRKKWTMVEMIEPDASVSLITLSKWETKKGPAYVIITEWNEVVKRNKLQEETKVQLWCFRADKRLCFALVQVDEEDVDEEDLNDDDDSGSWSGD